MFLTPTVEFSETRIEGRLVHRLRLGFLDHPAVRKRVMRDNMLPTFMEVRDVTTCNTGESVDLVT